MSMAHVRWSAVAAWFLVLGSILWLTASSLSTSSLLLIGIVGVLPPIVLLALSRQESPSTAAVIRDVEAGR